MLHALFLQQKQSCAQMNFKRMGSYQITIGLISMKRLEVKLLE